MSVVNSLGLRVRSGRREEAPRLVESTDGEIRGAIASALVAAKLPVTRIKKILGVGRSQIYLDMQRARARRRDPSDGADSEESMAG